MGLNTRVSRPLGITSTRLPAKRLERFATSPIQRLGVTTVMSIFSKALALRRMSQRERSASRELFKWGQRPQSRVKPSQAPG